MGRQGATGQGLRKAEKTQGWYPAFHSEIRKMEFPLIEGGKTVRKIDCKENSELDFEPVRFDVPIRHLS